MVKLQGIIHNDSQENDYVVNVECCLCGWTTSALESKRESAERRHSNVCKNGNPDGYSWFDFCAEEV